MMHLSSEASIYRS